MMMLTHVVFAVVLVATCASHHSFKLLVTEADVEPRRDEHAPEGRLTADDGVHALGRRLIADACLEADVGLVK